jgi:hypothetical protein
MPNTFRDREQYLSLVSARLPGTEEKRCNASSAMAKEVCKSAC